MQNVITVIRDGIETDILLTNFVPRIGEEVSIERQKEQERFLVNYKVINIRHTWRIDSLGPCVCYISVFVEEIK